MPSQKDREELDSDQEDGVVDYTNQRYDEKVRISAGFNVEDLTKGFVFSPEVEKPVNNDENIRHYGAEDINELVSLMEGNMRTDENGNDPLRAEDFDELKKRMEDITPARDGGVMKRVVKEGLLSQGTVPERAVVKIHFSLFLEGQDEPYDSTRLRGKAEKHRIGHNNLLEGLTLNYFKYVLSLLF